MEAPQTLHQIPPKEQKSWLDRPLTQIITVNWETIIFSVILITALLTRFYGLGERVMSHDETSHVYFSWLFEQGNGYTHDPVTHGPLQFHLVALSYFLFGDSDFSARIPAALFSIATVAFMWYYRRILGRAGALIAAVLFLVSPYMLYYGRYVRNEAYVGLFGVVTIWAILRYLADGNSKYLLWLSAATALHFATKETAFIYAAQALLFLAGYQIYCLYLATWPQAEDRKRFLTAIMASVLLLALGGGLLLSKSGSATEAVTETAIPDLSTTAAASGISGSPLIVGLFALGIIALGIAGYFLLRGYSWQALRQERAFGLLVIMATMILPMLAPLPVKILGLDPIDYQNATAITYTTLFIILLTLAAVAIGFSWNRRLWVMNAALFYGIFIVFYTTVFTNGFGFITGLVGSLGYWLAQQGVERGSQPWYYYALVQIPIYEFLPAIGSLLAMLFAPNFMNSNKKEEAATVDPGKISSGVPAAEQPGQQNERLTFTFLAFWSITSLVAYTIAGEKMPWLTVHITLPMILLTAWFLGRVVEQVDWRAFAREKGIVVLLVLPVLFASTLAAIGSLLGPNPPFQGKELSQLQATTTFITALLTAIASGWGLARLVQSWTSKQLTDVIILAAFAFLGLLTARAAFRAAYINYDNASEFLVYAHMARGPKEALEQIEEISQRTTDGLAIHIAYDNDTTYPYWWYLRNYTNKDYFGENPTRALREATAILVGSSKFDKIEPIVGKAYQAFEYTRIWWPNQDYFGLTWQRVVDALTDPQMRAALFQIWFNRDYTLYGQITNQVEAYQLPTWNPAQKMRLYIRKDVVSSLWEYGVSAAPEAIEADPYEGKQILITADQIIGEAGNAPGQFQRPRDIAIAPDGSLYIADTENHRIQHLDANGNVIHTWGSYGASTETARAPEGTFNEPWGIALGPDGAVYVADTWNNRIQKFSASGEFITQWGFGISQTDDPYGFYGPRDVAVNSKGQVFVTDTGNKRIVIFDSQGGFLSQFGGAGFQASQFDEPVGLAIDADDNLYVADTWNQRIQVFSPAGDGSYSPLREWDIVGWYGQSLDNKPYIAADQNGHLFVADPEGYRILEFNTDGSFIGYWGDFSTGADGFSLAGAVAANPSGNIWVSDTNNNRLMQFNLK